MKRLVLSAFLGLVNIAMFAQSKRAEEKDAIKTMETFKRDFKMVEGIYESNAKPYFIKFAEIQYRKPSDTTGFREIVNSRYQIYKQMAELQAEDIFKAMGADAKFYTNPYERKRIGEFFGSIYRNTFTGFDYAFYEKCKKDVAELKD